MKNNYKKMEKIFYIFNKYFCIFYIPFMLIIELANFNIYPMILFGTILLLELVLFLTSNNISVAKKLYVFFMAIVLSMNYSYIPENYHIFLNIIAGVLMIYTIINYILIFQVIDQVKKLNISDDKKDLYNVTTYTKSINRITKDFIISYSYQGKLNYLISEGEFFGLGKIEKYLNENNRILSSLTKNDMSLIKLIEY